MPLTWWVGYPLLFGLELAPVRICLPPALSLVLSLGPLIGMALTDEQITTGFGALSSDLAFLLGDRDVDRRIQGCFGAIGLNSVSLFALAADTREELRTMLAASPFDLALGGDSVTPAVKIQRRVSQAKVIDAWEASKHRVDERKKTEAEQRAHGQPLTLASGEHTQLRKGYQNQYGEVDDKAFPSDGMLDRRLHEIEHHELKAESLDMVVSADDEGDETWTTTFDKDGSLRMKKGTRKVPLPADSEALRRRIGVLGVSFTVARQRHPQRPWLSTAAADIWDAHLNYLLGEEVYGFRVEVNGVKHGPAWTTILEYELQMRKAAVKLITFDGLDIAAALKKVRKDQELRAKYFTTPSLSLMALANSAPPGSSSGAPPAPPQWQRDSWQREGPYSRKGSGKKGKGKGNKGGKGKVDANFKSRTPDGRQICFAYNSQYERCRGNCGRVHCCQVCFGSHPAHMHDKAAGTREAAAQGPPVPAQDGRSSA